MKKLLVFLLISASLSSVFFSCKKYEDGPMISFIPKTKRLAGDWNFDQVLYTPSGGAQVDSTSHYTGGKWNIQESNTGSYNKPGNSNMPFDWAWDDKKDNVIFTPSGTTTTYTYKVLKLMNKELWLRYTDASGNQTEYHLAQ